MANEGHALARDELIRVLTAYSGITTSDGAAGGSTLIDSNLIGRNDFVTGKTILIGSGNAAIEDSGAASFDPLTGEITVTSAFSAQIKAGTIFRILNISSVEIDVDVIDAKIGTNTDPAGTTTLFAWLAKLFSQGGQGLCYYGIVTDVPGANQFTIPTLVGFGDTAFCDWTAYVFWDTAGVDDPPQRESQAIATYASATGIFSTAPFAAPVDVGDIILILHPRIADIASLITWVDYEGATSLADKLTAARAGYLDELAAANIPADIDTLLTRVTAAVALASVCTEARLAELGPTNIPADTDPKVMGRLQIAHTTIDLNQAAGTYDLFTGTTQDVVVEKLVIRMPNAAAGGAITSISIQTDDTTPQEFISSTDGAVANLTAEAQLAWTGAILMDAGTGAKIRLTIAGGAHGSAYVCDVIAECRAVVSGGYLA